jgi:hypothetical protein
MPAITIPATAEYVTLELELETPAYTTWRAELKTASTRDGVEKRGADRLPAKRKPSSTGESSSPAARSARVYMVLLTSIRQGGAKETAATYTCRVLEK